MDFATFQLPGGYIDEDGTLHGEVEVAPLSGREEEFLANKQVKGTAALVTTVLSRCVHRIGTMSPANEEMVRNLLVADRQYLLLKVRELTFGENVQANIFCPWPDCGARVDIDFSIRDIPVRESVQKGPVYRMDLSEDAAIVDKQGLKQREVFFRLPSGADQEAVSPILRENEAKALSILLGRCILGIGHIKAPGDELVQMLSPRARMEIEKEMEAVAPAVDLVMGAKCPECGREFSIPFDLHDFFFGELKISVDLLYREVHYLAYHYHWSEREIMEMSREKRRRYIEVLADEIERLNNAV
ncbi:MAG: T4 bacteriophage base plate protein [Syntrophorhabdus sp. PtaU1.Bin153]|nr:MAG: T4 bacteriophage base plate protein [Syntrophorhabdus sp. PtaU1.Bin153]